MLRPLHDCILVKVDPLPEPGIIALVGSEVERQRTGTVLAVGAGTWTAGVWEDGAWKHPPVLVPVGVKKGDKVAFWREHLEHQQGKQITRTLLHECEDDVGLIRERDVLYALE